MSEPGLLRTSLYDLHVELGARIVPFSGWEMPVQFAGLAAEHKAVRTAAGLFDASHMGELDLRGEYAGQVVNYLVTNDVSKLEDGQALYTCACNERGTILDDLIVYRAAADRFLVVCNAGNHAKMSAHFRRAAEHHCDFKDVSSETALLALQGPKALAILALAGKEAAACEQLKSFHFTDAVIANRHATVARTGYTGEDGVEIFCKWDDAPAIARQLLELGRDHGLVPAGLGCRDTLRLEARLSLYGNDIDETTTPLEAGLGWVVKLDKGDFIGRSALVAQKEKGVDRKLIGFEMVGRGVARHGYPIKRATGDHDVIGIVTSGSNAPSLANKAIGLGYVPADLAAIGSQFLVDCRGKDIEAVVVKTPFYKRAKGLSRYVRSS